MKDGFAEFLKEIKERFRSPFFSAFFLTWIFHNYKIPLALFWYDKKDLSDLGFKDYFDFVEKNITYDNGLWFPLRIAIVYAFLIAPFLKIAVNLINALVTKLSSKGARWVGGGGWVKVENYIAQEDQYIEKKETLEKRIATYETTINENGELKNKLIASDGTLLDLRKQVSDLSSERTLLQREIDIKDQLIKTNDKVKDTLENTLSGEWVVAVVKDYNKKPEPILKVTFSNDRNVFIDLLDGKKIIFDVVFFSFNPVMEIYCLIITNNNSISPNHFFIIPSQNIGSDVMVGMYDNQNVTIYKTDIWDRTSSNRS